MQHGILKRLRQVSASFKKRVCSCIILLLSLSLLHTPVVAYALCNINATIAVVAYTRTNRSILSGLRCASLSVSTKLKTCTRVQKQEISIASKQEYQHKIAQLFGGRAVSTGCTIDTTAGE